MNLEKTSRWITIIGNAGLLLGVVLIIFQINQNSELVRGQLDHAMWTDRLNLRLALMGENPAAAIATAIENPSALSLEDTRVLNAYLDYWALFEVRHIDMYARGMTSYPPMTYSPEDPGHGITLRVWGNAYAKARFEESGFGPDLTPRLQGLISSLSGSEALNEHERLLGRIKEPQ